MERPDLFNRIFIGFLLLASTQTSAEPTMPPENVRAYLEQSASEYTMPEGSFAPYLQDWFRESAKPEPWAVNGDFDGDSIVDWAGLLRNEEGKLDLVVVYAPTGFHIHHVLASLGTDSDGISVGVELEPPGVIHGFPFDDADPKPTVTTSNPSIHLMYYEKSSVLYYWDGESFQEIWTSD